jgi:hypothetical protein
VHVERYAIKTLTVAELKTATVELEKMAFVLCANCQRLLQEWLLDPDNRANRAQLAELGMSPVVFLRQQRETREKSFSSQEPRTAS